MIKAADFATLPRNIAIVALFCTAIAAGVSFASHGDFWQSMIHSHAIGFSIFLPIDLSRRLVWGDARPPRVPLLALIGLCIVAGFFVGNALAAAITGRPVFGGRIFVSIAVTAFAGVSLNWYFFNRERLARLNAGAAEARLKLLQAQIEPHFLFNTLANLHSLIGSDPARAQKMLEHLNDYLRATLDATRHERGTLSEEFALLNGYLEVQKIRMGSRLDFSMQLPQDLSTVSIPPMLLQPLVENAIKHGLEPKVEGGRVDISAFSKDRFIEIQVADSGLGNGMTKGTGVGLANVRERLAVAYGARGTLTVKDNAAGGVTAIILIPA